MMSSPERRIAIVDDSRSVVSSLSEYLSYSGKVNIILTAESGEQFLEGLKRLEKDELPDVVLTDVNMPGMGGIRLVQQARAIYPKMKFIMLTAHDEEEVLFDAIRAGASGYLVKDEKISNIEAQIIMLLDEGGAPMSPRIASKTLEMLVREKRAVKDISEFNPENYKLSPREFEVLQLLTQGSEYKEIAANLFISPNTVRKHISNIYEKLHVSSKAQAINLMHAGSNQVDAGAEPQSRILLVDDHQIILDSLSMMLSANTNLEIIGKLSDSRLVLEFLRENPVDLIISDINMPYLNGINLAREILSGEMDVKIILLTVSEDQDQMQSAYNMGVHGYVLKKANKSQLIHAIEEVLKGELQYQDLIEV